MPLIPRLLAALIYGVLLSNSASADTIALSCRETHGIEHVTITIDTVRRSVKFGNSTAIPSFEIIDGDYGPAVAGDKDPSHKRHWKVSITPGAIFFGTEEPTSGGSPNLSTINLRTGILSGPSGDVGLLCTPPRP